MSEQDQKQYFDEGEEQEYREVQKYSSPPVGNDQQLGQDILRTFARVSDPSIIKYQIIRKRVPVFATKEIVDKNGGTKNVEYIEKWEVQEWSLPILIQPKYHELITDDIARAFLSEGDLEVYRSNATYCKLVKSFADRYEVDLSMHYNNFADENHLLTVSSGAFRGKRVMLAKTNIAEQTSRQSVTQMLERQENKKKGFLDSIINP